MSPPEGGINTGVDAGVGPKRGAVISSRAAVPESVQAAMGVSSSHGSEPPSRALSSSGMRAPHGEQSSGQLGKRKDGSVALQWVSTVKTDAQNQVPLAPNGKRICWADWCWVRCKEAPKYRVFPISIWVGKENRYTCGIWAHKIAIGICHQHFVTTFVD